MKNVVSYSLYGNKQIYWYGAIHNIDLCNLFYPNYICRIYIDNSSNKKLISLIEREKKNHPNLETVYMDKSFGSAGMFWRYLAAQDSDVNICLVRDIDSRITIREQTLVKQWLDSDKDFHIIRDHPCHTQKIMGGMWGCRNGIIRNIGLTFHIKKFLSNHQAYGSDERFLSDWLYNKIYKQAYEHSSNNIVYNNKLHTIDIPKKSYKDYIGCKIYNL